MPYATRADLTDRYGDAEIEQRESALPPGAVDRALADAGAEADGYLAARYPVPVDPVPTVLTRLVCDIARYYLLGDSATEQVRDRYTDAIKSLRDISAGRMALDGATAPAGGSGSATVEIVTQPKVWGRR